MSSDQPMSVVVEYQIRAGNNTMEQWLAEWENRAEDVQKGEPETTAYAAAVCLENNLQVLIFERYARGNGSLAVHMERPAHYTLSAIMGERRMTKRRIMGSLFTDVPDYGWWGRPESFSAACEGFILVVLGLRFEQDWMRDEFLKISSTHADYCWENEPDTVIYSGGLANADSDRNVDIKQGDLLFVMACTDMAAVEKHRDDANHLALGAVIVEKQLKMQRTFTQTYKTTGHGFLWRE